MTTATAIANICGLVCCLVAWRYRRLALDTQDRNAALGDMLREANLSHPSTRQAPTTRQLDEWRDVACVEGGLDMEQSLGLVETCQMLIAHADEMSARRLLAEVGYKGERRVA